MSWDRFDYTRNTKRYETHSRLEPNGSCREAKPCTLTIRLRAYDHACTQANMPCTPPLRPDCSREGMHGRPYSVQYVCVYIYMSKLRRQMTHLLIQTIKCPIQPPQPEIHSSHHVPSQCRRPSRRRDPAQSSISSSDQSRPIPDSKRTERTTETFRQNTIHIKRRHFETINDNNHASRCNAAGLRRPEGRIPKASTISVTHTTI